MKENRNVENENALREFAERMSQAVSRRIGEGCQVKLQEVMKNNGVLLQGLVILTEDRNISPTIYLNSLWELYASGTPQEEIVDRILEIYETELPDTGVDMSFFREYDKVEEKICYRLVNAAKNKALLEQVPNVPLLDLSLCFFYAYEDAQLGSGSILIRNNHMEMWDVSVEQLMRAARENTSRLYPWELHNMGELLKEYTGCEAGMPMKVLTNSQKVNGATCMIYPDVLSGIADKMGENLFILPSSIHEVIILPQSEITDLECVQGMIREVNASVVDPEEILSDSLYFYNAQDNRIESISFPKREVI